VKSLKQNKRKAMLYIGGVLLLLVATNPSNNSFHRYLSATVGSVDEYGRTSNLLIASFYHSEGVEYLGVCGNFFKTRGESNREKTTPAD
jgi:hypothetical protein